MSCSVKLKCVNFVTPVFLTKRNPLSPLYRSLCVSSVKFGLKDEFPVKWTRPARVIFYDPVKTGDLKPLPPLPLDKLPRDYEGLDELKDAHPLVHKVFSCGFQGRRFAAERVFQDMVDSVKAHDFDDESMEARIARLTFKIRNYQDHLGRVGNDPVVRKRLLELIHRRKRFLCQLRERDYRKFEWLLDKLDLIFKPHPLEKYIRIERKASIRKLTTLYCEDILKKKWAEYEEKLENEKRDFLKKKVETLKWVRQEQIDCKSEPTVSEEDIQLAESRAADFEEKWLAKEALKPAPKIRK